MPSYKERLSTLNKTKLTRTESKGLFIFFFNKKMAIVYCFQLLKRDDVLFISAVGKDLGFGLLVGQNKTFDDVPFCSRKFLDVL